MQTTILFSYKNRTTRYGIHKEYLNILGKEMNIRKIQELLGNLNVVIFSPEDLRLVKEGPRVTSNTYNYKSR